MSSVCPHGMVIGGCTFSPSGDCEARAYLGHTPYYIHPLLACVLMCVIVLGGAYLIVSAWAWLA